METFRSVSAIGSEWDSLADRVGAPPWMRPGWFDRWFAALQPEGYEIVCCRDDTGDVLGIFPIVRSSAVVQGASNSESPATGILATDGKVVEILARTVLSDDVRRFHFLHMTREDPDWLRFARAAEDLGFGIESRVVARSPYLSTEGSWEAFLERRGTAHFREERRKQRMLEREGDLRFEVVDGTEHIDLLFTHALAIEESGWKGRAGTSIADRIKALGFYRSLLRWARDRGVLRLMFLRLDGQAIAFDLAFEEEGVLYLFKTSYDEAFLRFSPGRVLRLHAIRWACDSDVKTYEFLGTDDAYKRKWTDDYRERLLVLGFESSVVGRLQLSAYRGLSSVRRRYLGPAKRKMLGSAASRRLLRRR